VSWMTKVYFCHPGSVLRSGGVVAPMLGRNPFPWRVMRELHSYLLRSAKSGMEAAH
jgi:hypothetical protein